MRADDGILDAPAVGVRALSDKGVRVVPGTAEGGIDAAHVVEHRGDRSRGAAVLQGVESLVRQVDEVEHNKARAVF